MITFESFRLLFPPLQVSVLAWISTTGPFVLFGFYYGFPTTLPIGISQILSIRSFLLEGSLGGTVSAIGSMTGQIMIFLSIYCSPLYIMLVKPHAVTLLVPLYMLFHWYRTKDPSKSKTLRPIHSITDARIRNIFIDGFIFQLLNPILLPSPALARMVNLFRFRHSNNVFFPISGILGWAGGHILFINLAKMLLVRMERDSPIPYVLIKRILHRTFSIIISTISSLHLGRSPVPLSTKKFTDEIVSHNQSLKNLQDELLWLHKPWPTSFFDQYRWNRPLRYIENSRFSRNGFVKERVSEYFFDKCLTDGKRRVSFTSLPGLSIFGKQLGNCTDTSDTSASVCDYSGEWIDTEKEERNALNNEFEDRIESVENGSTIRGAMEKRTGLYHNKGKILVKVYDPSLNGLSRAKVPTPKSPWLLSDLMGPKKKSTNDYAGGDAKRIRNRIRNWMSTKYQGLEREKFPLPWDPIPTSAQQRFLSIVRESEDPRIKEISNGIDPVGAGTQEFHTTWEHVFKLPFLEQAIFFSHSEREAEDSTPPNSRNISPNTFTESNASTRLGDVYFSAGETVSPTSRIEEMQKRLPRYNSILRFNRIDAVNTNTDIRQRKMKNLGFSLAKARVKRRIVKRFSKQSDFRRRLVKGSMRARRRKTMVWRMLQSGTHSPFFLRMMEIPTPFQTYSGVSGTIRSKINTPGIEEESISPPPRRERSKADRSAIAAGLDSSFVQSGRSILLIIQSNLRKYVVLPILIMGKNIGRILLFQPPEWNEDWTEWNREIHIKCTYDGVEFSDTHLPGRWFREGLQIKILYPLRLKPWHTRGGGYINLSGDEEEVQEDLPAPAKRRRVSFGYLTIWGYQTNLPFGDVKKQPSFWKPIGKELKKILIESFLPRIARISDASFKITNRFDDISGINTESTESGNDVSNSTRTTNQYLEGGGVGNLAAKAVPIGIGRSSGGNLLNKLEDQSELRFENIQDFGDDVVASVADETERIVEQSHLDKIEKHLILRGRDHKYYTNMGLVWKKQSIRIRQRLLQFRRAVAGLIQGWSHSINSLYNRIYRGISRRFISLIRSSVQLMVKLTKDLFRIFSETHQPSNIAKDGQDLRADHDWSVSPISQAYVFHRLRHTRSRIGLDLYSPVRYAKGEDWESLGNGGRVIPESGDPKWSGCIFIHSHLKNTEAQGLLEEPKTFNEKDWDGWLHRLNRYNPHSRIWYRIAPQEWKVGVKKHWDPEHNYPNERKEHNLRGEEEEYSAYPENPLLKRRISNISKRYRFNDPAYNFIDSTVNLDTKESPTRQYEKEEGILSNSHIRGIHKYSTSSGRKGSILQSRPDSNIDSDLMLWLVPDLAETKNVYAAESVLIPKASILQGRSRSSMKGKLGINSRYEGQEMESEELLLKERESHYHIFQWRWKSKALERGMQRIKNLASISSVMENEENITAFCDKMGIDADSSNRFFTEAKHEFLNQFLTVSAHRLPRVLDDQMLMYKMVSTLLKFRNRFEGRIDADVSSQCIPCLMTINNGERAFSDPYNLEDLSLPGRRRELRVLRSLMLEKQHADPDQWVRETEKYQEFNPSDRTRIIKRFLWPIHRLEDLACTNRFWFDANNGSRFTMLRIRMHPLN
uniref:Protein TIC 214 n=1 Tax=Botrychium ternatum TaxID=208695 RepID=A0A1B0PQF4_9MONI|nr:Ycf1 [Botrychium sp. ternatum/japonicum]